MAIYKTTSSKVVIRKIFRDLKPDRDNWSDDAIDKWMKFTGPGAQFGAEVGVLTGSSQLDRYKAGEDLTWGNLFNDAFFNVGFVGCKESY